MEFYIQVYAMDLYIQVYALDLYIQVYAMDLYIHVYAHALPWSCVSRGGCPGLSVLVSLMVSVDVKLY